MPETTAVVVRKEDKEMVYVPFGGKEEIKLSVRIVQDLICVKTKSGKVCSDNDAIKFLMMCKARLLNPFEGDAFLIGYDSRDGGPTFSLITAHQAFLKRAELNPEYNGMESGLIVDEAGSIKDIPGDFYVTGTHKVLGGWATVHFKNRKFPMHKRVRLERFKKPFGIWLDDAGGMIVKCAEADALRSSFPTMLGGLYLKEEMLSEKTTVEASQPIFSEPGKDDDKYVVESPPATAAAPSGPPVIKKAPKTPPAVKTPPAPVKEQLPLDVLKGKMHSSGLTIDKLLEFLKGVGNINDNVSTLEEIAIESPDVISIVVTEFDDINQRIKSSE